MLSILSYNIRYGKRLLQISNWLGTHSVEFDIVCLQEFPLAEIDVFLEILKQLPFEYRYSHSFSKKGKQYGQLTLFNTRKIKLIHDTVINLGTSLIEKNMSKERGERSALVTTFVYKKKQFTVVNMHLVCFALNKQRLIQLQKVLENTKALPKPQVSTVMLGDFNYSSIVRQKTLFEFMENHNFLNAYKLRTNRVLFVHQQLDYVFYKNCRITDVFMPRVTYSDHYPILFTLVL